MAVNTSPLKKATKEAKSEVQSFTGVVNLSGKALAGLALKAAAIVGPFLAIGKVLSSVSEAMGEIDSIAKTATKLGISSEELIGLQHAAGLSGVENLNQSLAKLVKATAEAARGNVEFRRTFSDLNMDVQALARSTPDKQIRMLADAFQKLESPTEKVRLAMKLFGNEGVSMVNMLNGGSAALDDATQRAKDLGVSFNDIDAGQVELANDALSEMGSILTGIYRQLAIEVAPLVTVLARKLTDIGIAGVDSGNTVTTGFSWITTAIGYVGDALDLLYSGFLFLQSGMTKGLAVIADYFQYALIPPITLLNKLTGAEIKAIEYFEILSEDLHRLAGEQYDDAFKSFLDKTPSENMKNLTDEVRAASKEIKNNAFGDALATNFVEAQEPGLRLLQTLEDQIRVLQMGAEAAELYKLAEQGVAPEIIAQVKALQERKRELEGLGEAADSQRAFFEDQRKEAERVLEKIKTPLERFRDEFQKLRGLKLAGLLDESQFQRAVEKARESLGTIKKDVEETKLDIQLSDLAEFGSREAANIIANHQVKLATGANQGWQGLERNGQRQLEALVTSNQYLRRIAERDGQELLSI